MGASAVRNCDMAFANIYCWQDTYRSEWAEVEGFLVVKYRIDGGRRTAYMQPIGADGREDFTPIVPLLEADAAESGQTLRIAGLTGSAAETLQRAYPEKFAFADNRNFADYIYSADDLRNLAGRRYQPKRNHLNRFNDLYDYRYEPLTARHKDECMALERQWRAHRSDVDGSIDAEQLAMMRGFDSFDELGLTGGAVYIDDRLAAFTYGSPINGDTFDIHIEKADTSYEGIFAAVNRLFACHIPERYEFVNREEDMGLDGLRRSKLSYHPVRLEKKTTAVVLDREEREIKRLWREVFGDEEAFIDKFLINCRTHTNSYLHYEREKLVSMLHIVPFRSEAGERIAYVYAVATDPEWRHKGLASALMTEAMESVRSSFDKAVLIPSDDDVARFYEKFRFVLTSQRVEFGADFDFGTGDAERNVPMVCELRQSRRSEDEMLRLEPAGFTALPEE